MLAENLVCSYRDNCVSNISYLSVEWVIADHQAEKFSILQLESVIIFLQTSLKGCWPSLYL